MNFDYSNNPFWSSYTPLNEELAKDGKKAPLLHFTKAEGQLSYDQCKSFNGISAVLAPDSVLLDADDEHNGSILSTAIQGEQLNCMLTDRDGGRGIHANLLDRQGKIKKNYTKVMLACGIVVDVKIGRKNGLECVRWQGVDRKIIYNESPYQEIPCWLWPVDTMIDFQTMGDGDGRNNALFSYILTLQRNGLTVEEIRQTIRIANKYVLREPISDKELEIILRDDAFAKECFFKKNKFLHDQFAEYIMRNHHICLIQGQLAIYQNGIYCATEDALERAIIKELPILKDSQIKEVTKRLRRICPTKWQSRPTLIAFSNGLYDLEMDEFKEFTPNEVILNKIPWPYNPAAHDDLLDHTLNRLACDDPEVRALLEEMVGYCMYRRNELGKAFILIGDKSNGKSTLCYAIQVMLGDQNIASLDLKELGDRFKTAELFGKLANIGDDIGDEFIANASVFKKLVTGDRVNVERKGSDPFEFNNYSKLIFSANDIPRIKDKTGAVQRRLVIVPFDAKFTPDDADYIPDLKYTLAQQEHIEYLILLGLEGLKRALQQKHFTEPQKVKTANREYEERNNPIIGFIEEISIDGILHERTKTVFFRYNEYCNANHFQALSKIEFSRQICKRLNLTTKKQKGPTVRGKREEYQIFEQRED